MNLTNYNYGYNNYFNCSIHGKIKLNVEEWKNIKKYILNYSVTPYYAYRSLLKWDLQNEANGKKGSILYYIRVTATEKIVKRFKIKNYKRGNYLFEIT